MHRFCSLVVSALLATAVPTTAQADEPVPAPQSNGVPAALITLGVVALVPSYAFAVSEAKRGHDTLYVPVLGPYLLLLFDAPHGDFAGLAATVYLADAAIQTAGAGLMIAGLHELSFGSKKAPITIAPSVSANRIGVSGRF